MEFKANFIGGVLVDFVFYGSYLLFFKIVFGYVDSLLEFSREDVTVFMIITFLVDTIYMFFFAGNLGRLNRLVVRGDLDFVLLKPVRSQFFVSFRYFYSYGMISIVILTVALIIFCMNMSRDISALNIVFFIYSFILGIILFYSLDFNIVSMTFWFRNFTVGGWLSHEIMKFSMRPDTIYTGWLRKTLFTFVPMALVASVPARMLLFGPDIKFLALQTFVTIVFFGSTFIVWKYGLEKYESASS